MYILYQSSIFDDIATILARELNFQTIIQVQQPDAYHILLDGANFDGKLPNNYDIIQFEQRNSKWITESYLNILKSASHVYDFSYLNSAFMQEKGINSILFTFGYS